MFMVQVTYFSCLKELSYVMNRFATIYWLVVIFSTLPVLETEQTVPLDSGKVEEMTAKDRKI